jgi:hypothetical protein
MSRSTHAIEMPDIVSYFCRTARTLRICMAVPLVPGTPDHELIDRLRQAPQDLTPLRPPSTVSLLSHRNVVSVRVQREGGLAMRIPNGLWALLLFSAGISPARPAAARHPHDRNGFLVGFGVGLARVTADLPNVHQEGPDPAFGGSLRLGWALRPNLTFGYESSGTLGIIDCNVYTLGATYYPWGGLYLRGGVGAGVATPELTTFTGDIPALLHDDQATQQNSGVPDRNGLGLLAALGYEWRLTRRFALGPQANFVYVNVGPNRIHTHAEFYTTQVNWYW